MSTQRWSDVFRYCDETDWDDISGFDLTEATMDVDESTTSPMKLEKTRVTEDEIMRWSSWTRPFPLPQHLSPTGGRLFDSVPDDVLMNSPPHMIAHLQRTAAQSGLQVISPRQTPFSCLMNRTNDDRRELGDHVVGSVAAQSDEWPTIDNADFSELLPDEPLPPVDRSTYQRTKTRTEPLTRASHLMKDPILSCLIKGRAVVDIQQRDDVMGDAGRLTELLAKAWSISKEQLMDLDAFSLGVDGPLLRHALKADDVFPIVYAPIHRQRSVSVGSNEVTREMLPVDSAMDWRRMRVFCEAVFLLSTTIEGYPLKLCRAIPPPGDPTAPLNRPNILAFRPAPCVAWSFEAGSFSVVPDEIGVSACTRTIPPEVLVALSRYTELVRPISHVLSKGLVPRTRGTIVAPVVEPSGETITQSYIMLTRTLAVGAARGKNSARSIRNYLYQAIDSASPEDKLRIARYIHIAKSEVKIHLKLDIVPDVLIHRIATNFLKIGETIRLKVAAEAAMRCSSVEEWWRDITSQVPERYATMSEGSMGWARVAMWLIFRAPTDKWEALERKMHYDAVRNSSVTAIGGVPLPPVHGSIERVLQASRVFVKGMTKAYYGYYIAVADVGQAIADILEADRQPRSAEVLRESCYLWYLRARALRGTNVDAWEKSKPTPSMNHLRITGPEMDLLVVPTPYRAFAAYKTHIQTSSVIHKTARDQIMRFDEPKISRLFAELRGPLAPAQESVVTRYLIDPKRLAADMEKAWRLLATDVATVVTKYALEAKKPAMMAPKKPMQINIPIELSFENPQKKQKPSGRNYFDLIGNFEVEDVDWMEDLLIDLPKTESKLLQERIFKDTREMRSVFEALRDQMAEGSTMANETVG